METKDLKTGTTTVGIIYRDGVVLAADKRASMGHIVYEEDSEKIYQINDKMALTNAGNVGDSQAIVRFLKSQAKIYELERGEQMSARAASTMLSNVLNSNRYFPYISQFIIGGFSEKPELYDLTPYGGVLQRTQYAVSGSGTEPALNTIDLGYKTGLSEKDAVALAVRAIESGKRRDVYSGGKAATVFVVDAKGVKQLAFEDVAKVAAQETTMK